MIPKTIKIGYEGEQNARYVDIDIRELLAMNAQGTANILHKRAGDKEAYPVQVERNGNSIRWTFSAADAEKRGYGSAQVVIVNADGTIVAKSKLMETVTGSSLTEGEEIPVPAQPWVNQVLAASAEVSEKVDDFIAGIESGLYKGEKGDTGATGPAGPRGQRGERG